MKEFIESQKQCLRKVNIWMVNFVHKTDGWRGIGVILWKLNPYLPHTSCIKTCIFIIYCGKQCIQSGVTWKDECLNWLLCIQVLLHYYNSFLYGIAFRSSIFMQTNIIKTLKVVSLTKKVKDITGFITEVDHSRSIQTKYSYLGGSDYYLWALLVLFAQFDFLHISWYFTYSTH